MSESQLAKNGLIYAFTPPQEAVGDEPAQGELPAIDHARGRRGRIRVHQGCEHAVLSLLQVLPDHHH